MNNNHDELPVEIETLSRRVDDLEARLVRVRLKAVKQSVGWCVAIALGVVLVLMALDTYVPKPGPETADDNLEQLLRPGLHCYNSGEEMAAARQRALTAVDRLEFEAEFTRTWDQRHPQIDGLPTTPPAPALTTEPGAVIPIVTEPTDPDVPAPTNVGEEIDDDLCFGLKEPTP
ncbi:hypothetical protein [Mycolicibacterium brumae]|uniref:Uncharacterized protein n=1 Tax=Mycolicibacterium brumae TaxID=85968 RepID=A0A2G5P575_9MYCO|nr:hypothetical protein [Mycolicibacterium brumae]MCV7194169.1 hypothetical protein [Mycolicibacterium brumae]PIB73183.1 hypothetical protein CQY22_017825 [Mycolicibacterium brumae]RWA22657.1 hypothetical protein MBRU_11955 [Mycolicibacterium brumae DSM 44177]UWW07536.1 hypothetical protein L2Z93_000553 [Mycolicibacterium brumae]